MTNAFAMGLSGLRANGMAVEATGNNLANLNTSGFKATSVRFRDLMSSSAVGMGTSQPVVARHFNQGGIQSSSGMLDAAILGDGFFIAQGNDNQRMYTRAGTFQVDTSGRLTTLGGERVQGWSGANGVINTNGPVGDITIPFGMIQPGKTTNALSLDLNLNAAGVVDQPSGKFSTTVEVYDSLGVVHPVTLTFTKTEANSWSYTATMPGSDFGDAAAEPKELASGDLTFDEFGKLTSPAADDEGITLEATGLASGASDLAITWSLFRPDGTSALRQTAQASASFGVQQDGAGAGHLLSVAMGDGGLLQANFSNGEKLTIAQVAIARFQNPESLESAGNNSFRVSPNTSAPSIGVQDTGGRGKVIGRSLEASTVDIAQEFTNLIVYQRGYQANSRIITTADELAQETMSLKR